MSEKNPPERRKDLLDIQSLSVEEITTILDSGKPFKDLFTRSVKKVPALRGKSVLNLFYEPSTRTRSSFEIAAKRLSADVTNFTVSSSSVVSSGGGVVSGSGNTSTSCFGCSVSSTVGVSPASD